MFKTGDARRARSIVAESAEQSGDALRAMCGAGGEARRSREDPNQTFTTICGFLLYQVWIVLHGYDF